MKVWSSVALFHSTLAGVQQCVLHASTSLFTSESPQTRFWWWISSTCIWLVLIAGCAVKRMYHSFMNDHFGSQHGLEQLIGQLHLTFAKVELPALTVLEGLKSRMLCSRSHVASLQ